jgi:hypothetical protein
MLLRILNLKAGGKAVSYASEKRVANLGEEVK